MIFTMCAVVLQSSEEEAEIAQSVRGGDADAGTRTWFVVQI